MTAGTGAILLVFGW